MPPKNAVEGQIYKATYSGVPVYECLINAVAVMRRRADNWLNATQILKVVGLDKPQRTRVLERDVQRYTHEKVQGGYGKYQGTWIPLESAVKLAQVYNIAHLLEPITSYVPSEQSPPPAPKHITASSNRSAKKATPAAAAASAKKQREATADSDSMDLDTSMRSSHPSRLARPVAPAAGSDGSLSPSPSETSSSSRTPSPVEALDPAYGYQPRAGTSLEPDKYGRYARDDMDHAARYAEIILDYFISESTTIPLLLITPPSDFDPNMSIDDDEHTPLHWACAMGRVRVVKLLLSAGADMFRVNTSGQTALMRAVMFSNNYDLRKFPELFDLLHRSILNIDRSDRTVFHHTTDLALTRGKPHAARYYLETMLTRLRDYGTQLADMLNFPDDEEETALTMAARARSKRLVRLLLEHGADAKKRNHEGKSAEDYIVEDERFRASPPRTTAAIAAPAAQEGVILPPARPHVGEAAQRAIGQVSTIANHLHALADAYDAELVESDRTLSQAQSLQTQIVNESSESARILAGLAQRAEAAGGAVEASSQVRPRLQSAVAKRRGEDLARSYAYMRARTKRVRTQYGLPEQQALLPTATSATEGTAESFLQPVGPAGIEAEIQAAQRAAQEAQAACQSAEEKYVDAALAAQGTGPAMAAYRRLISISCGGVAVEDVDAVVGALGAMLDRSTDVPADNGDASATSAAGAAGATMA